MAKIVRYALAEATRVRLRCTYCEGKTVVDVAVGQRLPPECPTCNRRFFPPGPIDQPATTDKLLFDLLDRLRHNGASAIELEFPTDD